MACAAITGALALIHFLPATTDVHYFAVLTPVAILGTSGMFVLVGPRLPSRLDVRRLALLAALIFAAAQIRETHRSKVLPSRPSGAFPEFALGKFALAGRFITAHTEPEDEVLALNPALAIYARRPLTKGLEMSTFSLRPDWDDATCRRHHVVNWPILIGMLRAGRPRAVALSVEEMGRLDKCDRDGAVRVFREELFQHYVPALKLERFGQFRSRLRVFLRNGNSPSR